MKKNFKSFIVDFGMHMRLAKDLGKEVSIDFERMSEKLKDHHVNLESRSLSKLWKYLHTTEKPKRKTLDRLSIFAGFQSWEDLQQALMGK